MSAMILSDSRGHIYPKSESAKLVEIRATDPRFHKWSKGEIYRALAAEKFQTANGRSATEEELNEYVDFLSRWSD